MQRFIAGLVTVTAALAVCAPPAVAATPGPVKALKVHITPPPASKIVK